MLVLTVGEQESMFVRLLEKQEQESVVVVFCLGPPDVSQVLL